MTSKSKKRLLVSLLLVGFLITSATGQSERLFGIMGLDSLSGVNRAYLEASSVKSIGMFGVLSTIKVGLAIVEGSELGVGFGLQVGDIVQAAYDYVDIAWRTVLAGTVILFGTKYLLEAAALVDQWFLVLTLCFALSLSLLQWLSTGLVRTRRVIRDVLLLFTVLTIALYLVLPLSVAGGAFLSRKITSPSVREAEAGIVEVRNDLFSDIQYGGETSLSKITDLKEKIKYIVTYIKGKTSRIVSWMFSIIAGYIFDCLIFPFTLFVLLLWLTRASAKYLFGIQQLRTLREDLDDVMARYFIPKSTVDATKDVPDAE